MESVDNSWSSGLAYEDFMGRWSRKLAPKFVEWLQVPAGTHWLDVGCGTGALADAIHRFANPASVVGCDPARPFIEFARVRCSNDRTSFVLCGADSLPGRAGGFGSVTSAFALNFFPDPASSVEEMRDVAASGGTVSSCVWDYSGRMELLRCFWDSVSRIDPDATGLDEGNRFPICRPGPLTALFRNAGLRDVRCDPIEIPAEFSSFDEYWKPFLGGTGPAPSYVGSLDDRGRATLVQDLERSLPKRPDGSIRLIARAWAVRGRAV